MSTLKRFFTAAGAFLRAVAAFLVRVAQATWKFFARVNDTYRGYVNVPELVSVILVALASGNTLEAVVTAVAQHTGTIFTNVNADSLRYWTTILMALAGILHRFSSGAKISTPADRQANPRTRG